MEVKWLVISGGMTIAGIIIGWALSFWQQRWTREQDRKDEVRRQEQRRKDEKWKQKQLRINTFLEKRWKTYSEGLVFVLEVEEHQRNPDELKAIQNKWKEWYPSNCLYLPNSVREALRKAINFTTAIIVDINNKTENKETWETFKENQKEAKAALMNLSDVGWLPEDLE